MWSVWHRWGCSSSLSEPVLFHLTVHGRKANCIMTKDNVWKKMKDSDVAVLWFLMSIQKWEGKKFLAFHDHNSFYLVSLGVITPSESWDVLSFVMHSIQMLKYKEAQKAPVVSTASWNEVTRDLAKIPAAELRAELILPHLRKPVPAKVHFWAYL